MSREANFFFSGQIEGIMIVLQELSVKDGFTNEPTKGYVIEKLQELNLDSYIDRVIAEYYSNN